VDGRLLLADSDRTIFIAREIASVHVMPFTNYILLGQLYSIRVALRNAFNMVSSGAGNALYYQNGVS
jgi:hypothetical protein